MDWADFKEKVARTSISLGIIYDLCESESYSTYLEHQNTVHKVNILWFIQANLTHLLKFSDRDQKHRELIFQFPQIFEETASLTSGSGINS